MYYFPYDLYIESNSLCFPVPSQYISVSRVTVTTSGIHAVVLSELMLIWLFSLVKKTGSSHLILTLQRTLQMFFSLSSYRPLIPVSKLTVSESYENYMSRSYQVTKDILSDCKNTGKGRSRRGCWARVGELLPSCLSTADVASCLGFHSA